MNRATFPAVLFAVLIVTSMGVSGSTPEPLSTNTISDSAEGGWDQTSPEANISNGNNGYELDRSSDSYDTSYVLDRTAESGRLDVTYQIEDNQLGETAHSTGTSITTPDYSGTMDRTAVTTHNGDIVFLVQDNGYDESYIYDENGDRVAQIPAGYTVGGLVDTSDSGFGADLMTGYWGTQYDFVLVNNGEIQGITAQGIDDMEHLGITQSPNGDNRFFVMDSTASEYDDTATNIVEVEITGDFDSGMDSFDIDVVNSYDIGEFPNHRGLEYKEETNTFVTYDESSNEYVEFGNVQNDLKTVVHDRTDIGYNPDGVGAVGAIDGDSYVHVQPQQMLEFPAYDTAESSSATWTSEPIDIASSGDISGAIGVSTEAIDNYGFEVQTREAGGEWITRDSTSISGAFDGSSPDATHDTLEFDIDNANDLELRVQFQPDEARYPPFYEYPARVTYIELDHGYYVSDGTVRAHDEYEADQGIDFSEAQSLDELTVDGVDANGSQVDVEFVNSQNEVVCAVTDVVNSRTDLATECDIDFGQYENQELFLDFQYTSTGDDSDSVESWELTYEERDLNIDITDWEVVGGYNSDDPRTVDETEFRSAIESTDRFQITGVDGDDLGSEIDAVRWYINGDEVGHHENVPVDEIPALEHTWDDSGTHTVTAEVFHGDHGTATQTWEVSVYDILIGGQDSYAGSEGDVISVVQQFQVFETDDAEIDYELEYDEDVLRFVEDDEANGTIEGTVDSGMSRVWEFQIVEAGYSGEPITITATYDDVETEKQIHVSSRDGGGWTGGNVGDRVLSNTWLESLIGGLEQQTYIYIQTILTGGGLAALWLHHRRVIGFPVGNEILDQIGARHKAAFSIVGGALGVGLILPWVIMVTVVTGGVWYFWDRIAEVIAEI